MNETKVGVSRGLSAEPCKLTARLDCKRVQNLFAKNASVHDCSPPPGTNVRLFALTLAGSATSTLAFSLMASRSSELLLLLLSGITPAFSASPALHCCDAFVDDAVNVGTARLSPPPLSVLLRSESGRGSPLRKCRIGLDHLAKQRESTRASASRAAMTRTPTRFRWPSKACVRVAPLVVVVAAVALLLLGCVERQ